jgi:hypothetical protein
MQAAHRDRLTPGPCDPYAGILSRRRRAWSLTRAGFSLQPASRPLAGQVGGVEPFATTPSCPTRAPTSNSISPSSPWHQPLTARTGPIQEQAVERRLAVHQGSRSQVLVVEVEEVEGHEGDRDPGGRPSGPAGRCRAFSRREFRAPFSRGGFSRRLQGQVRAKRWSSIAWICSKSRGRSGRWRRTGDAAGAVGLVEPGGWRRCSRRSSAGPPPSRRSSSRTTTGGCSAWT